MWVQWCFFLFVFYCFVVIVIIVLEIFFKRMVKTLFWNKTLGMILPGSRLNRDWEVWNNISTKREGIIIQKILRDEKVYFMN